MKKLLLLIILFITAIVLPDSHAQAMNGWWEGPYGDYCPMWGSYGARKPVRTAKEAKKILQEYFKNEPIVIGNIKEREYFFEADIKDKNNNLIDVVIVDKRTGRIRSIY
ncbi:MAG: hypothetical protein M1610_01625 [Nitrospirae bacterium]|nr:hypothetical protein [Nitrospirota bacterium]MDA8215364.1 hypothetical protein [Nitrospiraceae bacterium]MDA8339505.1 hypothetical protein [Nitrospiraceae bacterium]